MSAVSNLEMLHIFSNITEDQRPFYYQANSSSNYTAAIILLFSLAWGSAMKAVIYSYYKNIKGKEKLVNLYIMFDVIFHHIVQLIYIPTYAGILLTRLSPTHLLNMALSKNVEPLNVCLNFARIGWFKFGYSSVSGLGIALFRVLCIRKTTYVKTKIGENQLLLLIALINFIASGGYKHERSSRSIFFQGN